MSHLQIVQNAAARLITETRKRQHITPALIRLHWLPVRFRIDLEPSTGLYIGSYWLFPCHQGTEIIHSEIISSSPFKSKNKRRLSFFSSRICFMECSPFPDEDHFQLCVKLLFIFFALLSLLLCSYYIICLYHCCSYLWKALGSTADPKTSKPVFTFYTNISVHSSYWPLRKIVRMFHYYHYYYHIIFIFFQHSGYSRSTSSKRSVLYRVSR